MQGERRRRAEKPSCQLHDLRPTSLQEIGPCETRDQRSRDRQGADAAAAFRAIALPYGAPFRTDSPDEKLAGSPDAGANWWLTDLDVPEGYMGALAVEEGIERIVYFDWKA